MKTPVLLLFYLLLLAACREAPQRKFYTQEAVEEARSARDLYLNAVTEFERRIKAMEPGGEREIAETDLKERKESLAKAEANLKRVEDGHKNGYDSKGR